MSLCRIVSEKSHSFELPYDGESTVRQKTVPSALALRPFSIWEFLARVILQYYSRTVTLRSSCSREQLATVLLSNGEGPLGFQTNYSRGSWKQNEKKRERERKFLLGNVLLEVEGCLGGSNHPRNERAVSSPADLGIGDGARGIGLAFYSIVFFLWRRSRCRER